MPAQVDPSRDRSNVGEVVFRRLDSGTHYATWRATLWGHSRRFVLERYEGGGWQINECFGVGDSWRSVRIGERQNYSQARALVRRLCRAERCDHCGESDRSKGDHGRGSCVPVWR